MEQNAYPEIAKLLTSTNPDDLHRGLKLVEQEISRVGTAEARPLFEMVSSLFYIDPLDQPDLMPILNEAITLVVGFGQWVIPVLVEHLDCGDLKAQMAIAQALGRIGADAVGPLVDEYQTLTDSSQRSFILYALGRIKSPKISQAAHLALEAALSSDLELRDTATRALGKFAESIPADGMSEEMRRDFLAKLHKNLADTNAGVRAKAVRSLGKLAKYGHLNEDERDKLKGTLNLILGKDENFEWDRAYVVRKQAEEAMQYV